MTKPGVFISMVRTTLILQISTNAKQASRYFIDEGTEIRIVLEPCEFPILLWAKLLSTPESKYSICKVEADMNAETRRSEKFEAVCRS